MISSNVIKGVHELLEERGIHPEPAEPLEETVAKALRVTRHQSEIFLELLHDGATVNEAATAARIDSPNHERDLLIRIARAIGSALAEVQRTQAQMVTRTGRGGTPRAS